MIIRTGGRQNRGFVAPLHLVPIKLVHVLAADAYGPFGAQHRDRLVQVAAKSRGAVNHGSQCGTSHFKGDSPRIVQAVQILVGAVVDIGLNTVPRPQDPLHRIDDMGELGVQGPTVQLRIPLPTPGTVIRRIPIPVTLNIDLENFAQFPAVHEFFEMHQGGIQAGLHHHPGWQSQRSGPIHQIDGLTTAQAKGLFDQGRHAHIHRKAQMGGVPTVGAGNHHQIRRISGLFPILAGKKERNPRYVGIHHRQIGMRIHNPYQSNRIVESPKQTGVLLTHAPKSYQQYFNRATTQRVRFFESVV